MVAAVTIYLVAIITLFVAHLTRAKVGARDPVATHCGPTLVGAHIAVVPITVITDFAVGQDVVPAGGAGAIIVAPVAVDAVAVVTLLAGPEDTVSADAGRAIIVAPIAVDLVAVIADLFSINDTVSTARLGAV